MIKRRQKLTQFLRKSFLFCKRRKYLTLRKEHMFSVFEESVLRTYGSKGGGELHCEELQYH
jgi:hypothetical protein